MIKCNLAVLLAERGMNISELSERTGLSRNTLSALQNNTGKGIQFDTMDSICKFLDITHCELFTYADVGFNGIFTHPNKKQIHYDSHGLLNIVKYSGFYEVEIFYNETVIKMQGLLNTDTYPRFTHVVFSVKDKARLEKIPLIFRQEIFNDIIDIAFNEINVSYDLPIKIEKNSVGIKFLDDDFIKKEIRDFIISQDGEIDEFLEQS
ncbi:helix-turn-helix domain-containing protein [Paenibacillus lutimineralis]|uniref:XRE family transcriptional regulator n=1 Tax=Paenibacillus lutimineralis TaxID=2707005 RepID=A0A3Q9I7P0_9BACL|nr:helix-turn-helix transcriptional regulator [Paenibacillus lutimineralis]AZS14565.1 XRE family transcriptional regulator [Paenibacillus lutimineralis]